MARVADVAAFDGDADLEALRRIVSDAHDFGAANIPFWGGLDIRPGNVMADASGQLKLIDPLFVGEARTILAADPMDIGRAGAAGGDPQEVRQRPRS